ncbi:tail fiber domain-containing protein [Enterococcus sp. LJL51]|uniref:tail fiber domain-containing protein n=1 Tax=Enterococcus sp. LJL51 TaxID=3416656 RepID=UPI003CE74C37
MDEIDLGQSSEFREYEQDQSALKRVKNEFTERGVNVKWFGAQGDGTTDDTAAVLEAEKIGMLFFPKGSYLLRKLPTTKIKGAGAVIKWLSAGIIREYVLNDTYLQINRLYNNIGLGINTLQAIDENSVGNTVVGDKSFLSKGNRLSRNVGMGTNIMTKVSEAEYTVVIGDNACRDTVLTERNTVVGSNAGLSMGDTDLIGTHHFYREDVDTGYLDNLWTDWRDYVGEKDKPLIIPENTKQVRGNVAVGRNALGWTIKPTFNTAVGYNALEKAVESTKSVAIGVSSAYNSIKSSESVVVGSYANMNNSISSGDVSLGAYAMEQVPFSKFNVSIGFQALHGKNMLRTNPEISDNIAIGRYSLSEASGDIRSNVAIGSSALKYTQGKYNTALGQQALEKIAGDYNTAVGLFAARDLKNIKRATAVGYNALNNPSIADFENITGIGQNSSVTGSNQLQLGNSQTTPYAFNPIQLRSDARDKIDIRDTSLGLNFIKKIQPREFRWNNREFYSEYETHRDANGQLKCIKREVPNDGSRSRKRYHQGFIAQEIKAVMEELDIDFSGYQDHSIDGGLDVKSIAYEEFIAPIIQAIQELNQKIEELEEKVATIS